MHTAFKLQLSVCALACYHKHGFLDTAKFGHIKVDFFNLPSVGIGIVMIHFHQFGAEKTCLFTTCATTDFNDNVVVLVGVFGEKCNLQVVFVLFEDVAQFVLLCLQKVTHIGVCFDGKQFLTILKLLFV